MSTTQQIADLFKGKMTSHEQYIEAATKAYRALGMEPSGRLSRSLASYVRSTLNVGFTFRSAGDVSVGGQFYHEIDEVNSTNWWWQREAIRQYTGVYPYPTDTLTQVIAALHLEAYAVHMSNHPDTPEAVCYTPDNAMGQADRQVRLSSLSKLITKLFPLASEKFKQAMDAAHKAELDPTVTLAESAEDILRVYQTTDGDTGCMRYDSEHWGLPSGYHPSNVYASAGVAVAYHEVGGAIKARALTWTDPATGRKQYVRVYGDRVMARKLERAGYEYGSMAGAKIRAVKMPEERYGEHAYLVPYIDGGCGNANHEGTAGYIDVRDPDHIQLVSEERRDILVRAGIEVSRFRDHRNVVHYLKPQDLSSLYFTCPLTGVSVDRTRDRVRQVWWYGKVQQVLETADVHRRFPQMLVRIVNGTSTRLYHTADVPKFYWGSWVVDDEQHRAAHNFVRLSARYYPQADWVQSNETVLTRDSQIIRKDDCVCIVHLDNTEEYIHKSEQSARLGRKSGFFSIGQVHNVPHYAHKDHPLVVVLRSGKRAMQGYNEIVKLFDGTWTHKRNVEPRRFYGEVVQWLKGEQLPVDTSMSERALRMVLGNAFDIKAFCELALLRSGMNAQAATKFVRDTLTSRFHDGKLNRAAGVLPVFNSDNVYCYSTTNVYMHHPDTLRRTKLGIEGMSFTDVSAEEKAHFELLHAVLAELLSIYDNAETLVTHALNRMTEATQLYAEAA